MFLNKPNSEERLTHEIKLSISRNRRLVLTIMLALCAALATYVASHAGGASPSARAFHNAVRPSKRQLSFEDRVNYQRIIEEVYWRHRVWPKENPQPKPPLDEVMPKAQTEKKVESYLTASRLLKDRWQEPITAEQMQGEM